LRTIIVHRRRDRSVFLHGFARSAVDNVDDDELRQLKLLATRLLGLTEAGLTVAVNDRELQEVNCDALQV
jgi:hypothetical protein